MSKVRVPRRTVKGKRLYDARRRREQASRSRDNAIEAAERRFLRNGYANTTIAEIADDAAVSVDTIYKSFCSKAGLIRANRARAPLGEGTMAAERRAHALHTHEAHLPTSVTGFVRFTNERAPRACLTQPPL